MFRRLAEARLYYEVQPYPSGRLWSLHRRTLQRSCDRCRPKTRPSPLFLSGQSCSAHADRSSSFTLCCRVAICGSVAVSIAPSRVCRNATRLPCRTRHLPGAGHARRRLAYGRMRTSVWTRWLRSHRCVYMGWGTQSVWMVRTRVSSRNGLGKVSLSSQAPWKAFLYSRH